MPISKRGKMRGEIQENGMGSRLKPNHGGSGLPHTRKSRPPSQAKSPVRYEPIRSIEELETYLSGATITCLICGSEHKSLGHHVSRSHAISPKQYKEMFNIPSTRSLCGSGLREMKSEITKSIWRDNPKMESVRKTLKENISNLDGTKHRSKSTLALDASRLSVKRANEVWVEAAREKYRELYLGMIEVAIRDGVTLYSLAGSAVDRIYRFAERHKDDSEFCQKLEIARGINKRDLPVGVKSNGNRFQARYSNTYIGTYGSVSDALKARQEHIDSLTGGAQ